MSEHGPKAFCKHLVRRFFRPAIDASVRESVDASIAPLQSDLNARLASLESVLSRSALPVWHGGLDGCLIPSADPALESRTRESLKRWHNWADNPGATRTFSRGFHETLLEWQLARLRHLGHWHGISDDTAFVRWCCQRSAVELSTSPHPAVSAAPFRWAAAADPLMDAWLRLDLLPPNRANFTPIIARHESLPLPDACADLVISSSALADALDARAVLAEARRILAPSGSLFIYEDTQADQADTIIELARSASLSPTHSRTAPARSPNPLATTEFQGLFQHQPATIEAKPEMQSTRAPLSPNASSP